MHCAFRDDGGVVKSVETYQVKAMPRMARDCLGHASWDANACLVFGDAMCQLLRRTITENNVFGIRFDGRGGDVVIWKMGPEYAFLPESFRSVPDIG